MKKLPLLFIATLNKILSKIILFLTLAVFVACQNTTNTETNSAVETSGVDTIEINATTDSNMPQTPQEYGLAIDSLINHDQLADAKELIQELKNKWPNSTQASEANKQLINIQSRENEIEQERIARLTKISPLIFGITLGDSKASVLSKLKNKGIKLKSTQLGGTGDMYSTANVMKSVGYLNLDWTDLTIGFNNDKLYSICFSIVTKNEPRTKHIYERMLNVLKDKYGGYNEQTENYTYWEDPFTSVELYNNDEVFYVYINYESKNNLPD